MSNKSLFHHSQEILEFMALLDGVEEDVEAPDLMAQIAAYIEEMRDAANGKIDAIIGYTGELTARAKARRQEAERLNALAALDEARAERLKLSVLQFFERHNIVDTVHTARYRLRLRLAGGNVPVVLTEDANPLDDGVEERFTVTNVKVTFDMAAVRLALQAGEELPFARLGERKKILSIS